MVAGSYFSSCSKLRRLVLASIACESFLTNLPAPLKPLLWKRLVVGASHDCSPCGVVLVGGCGDWQPDMVQCYNEGVDGVGGVDPTWKCEASMPDGYSFRSVEVRR